MAGIIFVKIASVEDIRMLSVDLEKVSHTRFVALVAEKYNISYDKEKKEVDVFHATYAFKYVDSEGDVVTISDKTDFNAWLEMAKCNVTNPKSLRLNLVNKNMDEAEKVKAEKKSVPQPEGSNWWNKKAKYEKKLRKLKMLPTTVKAGIILEVISDDPAALAPYVHDSCHHLKGKGKGKGEKGKGKGEKGKGKSEKGKGHAIWSPYEEYPGYDYGIDRDSWWSGYSRDQDLSSHDEQYGNETAYGRGWGKAGKGAGKKVLLARFVRDVTITPGETVSSGAKFTKTWRVRNDSGQPWPANSMILFVGGDPMEDGVAGSPEPGQGVISQKPILSQDTCLPGEELDVSIDLHAPTLDGTYEAFWRLCANFPDRGFKKFGMRLRVKVNVCTDTPPNSAPAEVKCTEPDSALEEELTEDSETENNEFVHIDA